ncbi:MAG: phosphoribosylformylglycinamidine synthase subunit PurL, partial [Bdellovibrionales bacterium]|nr:phosphoribosylformylglycinamidine synthase subunit PurL [Bdellovibrionales bacterium]
GLVEHNAIFRGFASGPGNSIVYVGSKTGRDGIHGATMASEVFDDNSEEKRPTVQVGDPFQEKLLLEACLDAMRTGVVVGIQDMGAAGMTSSSFEMAERAGTGVRIDLDKVPQRETGMNPYEIMLSESQERMLLVVEKGKEQAVLDIFKHWELDGVIIGEVTAGNSVDLYWHGELVSDIPVQLLTSSVPEYRWPEEKPLTSGEEISLENLDEPVDLSSVWLNLISSANLCSRRRIYNQYDSTVRTNTVIHPGGDAALIRIKNKAGSNKPEKGVAMTLDCNSRYCQVDPRQGTALTLAEACRNLTAVGARPIGISDCLNFGSPERPEGMWQIAESIRGLGEACRAFKVPVVSGNVSLYNETKGTGILPTPTLAVVGLIDNASKSIPAYFCNAGDRIMVIGEALSEIGGSEYLAQHFQIEKGPLPSLDYDLEINTANLIRMLVDKEMLNSCHDISSGGLAIALAECAFSMHKPQGAVLEAEQKSNLRKDVQLFAETGARYIISYRPELDKQIREEVAKAELKISFAGEVGGNEIKIGDCAMINFNDALKGWRTGLDSFFD